MICLSTENKNLKVLFCDYFIRTLLFHCVGVVKIEWLLMAMTHWTNRETMSSIFYQVSFIEIDVIVLELFFITFSKFAVLIHCLSGEGRFKIESCKLSIFNDVNELVKLEHKECFSFECWDLNGFSESSNKSDGSVLGSLISLYQKPIKEYSRWIADTTI